MSRVILRRFLITISAVTGLFFVLYLFSAQSLSWLATLYLQHNGFEGVSVKTERPDLEGILIQHLSATIGNTSVTATGIQVGYDQSVFQGRLRTIEVNSVRIRQDKLIAPDKAESPASNLPDLPDLSSLWTLVPVNLFTIADLVVLMEVPDLQIGGRARLDPEQATVQLTVNSKMLPGALDAAALLQPSGELEVIVGLAGEQTMLEVTGFPDLAANQVELSATLHVTNNAFRFVQAVLASQALLKDDLIALLDSTPLDGSVSVKVDGKIPWVNGAAFAANVPGTAGEKVPDWQQLNLQVDAELDVSADLPVVGVTGIRGPLSIAVEDGQFVVSSVGVNIKAQQVMVDAVTYRVFDESAALLTFDFEATLDDAAEDVMAALAGSARVAWSVIVSSDSDVAQVQRAESSGFFSASKRRGQVIEDMDVLSKLTFSAQDIARSEGFKNAAVHGDLELVVSENTATLSAKQVTLALAGIQYNGVPYLVELVKPAGLALKMAIPRQKLAGLLARTSTQPPLTLVKAFGNINLEASVSSDDPAAILAFGSVATGLNFDLDAGMLSLNLLEGAVFDLALASMDVGLKAGSPARISWDLGRDTLLMDKSEWTVRIPELTLLDQRVAFRNAQLSLESINYRSPVLKLKGLVKARSSRSAVPLAFDVLANINLEVADFSIQVDHQIQQPLLKTEFSGWRSPYDLGSGALKLGLTGKANWSENTVAIDAEGDISISAGAANYDDIKFSGLAANFPVSISSSSPRLLPGRLSIDAIDAGVPVQNVRLLMHTDFVQAAISNLRMDMLGAKIQTSDFTYILDQESALFDVNVAGLPVANVLLLEGEDIKGDGILDGDLSVVLSSAGPSIPFGKLTTRAPGGKLAYQGSLPDSTPGLSLAIMALRNFIYRQMDVDVKLVPNGDLNLLVKLQGHSPDVEKGRPINFNLNVSENLPALMESLQASDKFSKRVQQRLSKQPVN